MKRLSLLFFLWLISFSMPFPAMGQTHPAGQAKQQSCDGVLDVVPRKAVTFQRKRRPTNAPQTQATSTNHTPRKKTGK